MLVELLITFSDGHRTAKIMTTKPEFTKPFNIEHAKAGAPYGCRDGDQATVLKWDGRRFNEPLVGCIGVDDVPASWGGNGRYVPDEHGPRPRDLVMLPLGLIDGKPVFVGDELEQRMTAGWVPEVAQPRWATFPASWTSEFRWPAPAPVYPTTMMAVQDFNKIECKGRMGDLDAMQAVANFALRHAIDAGQVVTAADHESALAALGDQLKGIAIARDAARDMAVAKEVVLAAEKWLKAQTGGPGRHLSNGLDNAMTYAMPEIIAGVAK